MPAIRPTGLRMRADSTGSTRQAFYSNTDMPPLPSSRKSKKKSPKKSTTTHLQQVRQPLMADYATLALSDVEGGLGQSHPPIKLAQRPPRAGPSSGSTVYDAYGGNMAPASPDKRPYVNDALQAFSPVTPDHHVQYRQNSVEYSDDESDDDESSYYSTDDESDEEKPSRFGIWIEDLICRDNPASNLVRNCIFNPELPEFNTIQLGVWSTIIGVSIGFYTAFWKVIINAGIDFVWKDIPTKLLAIGFFSDVDGWLPMFHYMWICPVVFGGLLGYLFAAIKDRVPTQDDWISSLHSQGIIKYSNFPSTFALCTLGMFSGLSLGPELPLVLTGGMFGSWIGTITRQSMLHARVLNITGAGAAVGGFFGFPMAGAFFALEIPHRMGPQYFEAQIPASFASILAAMVHRYALQEPLVGIFEYPMMEMELSFTLFLTHAVVFGVLAYIFGIGYIKEVKWLKKWVHDLFHAHHGEHDPAPALSQVELEHGLAEAAPLLEIKAGDGGSHSIHKSVHTTSQTASCFDWFRSPLCCQIRNEPLRAGYAGAVAGGLVGVIGMFLPHVMFWGEEQLQTLIDKGRTPLPVFGQGDELTVALTAMGYCMIDHLDPDAVSNGFSIGCSASIALAKIIDIGLSLGTGIIGGHFWGPLFSGALLANAVMDLLDLLVPHLPFLAMFTQNRTIAILCMMGGMHAVVFRAFMAITLILTETMKAYTAGTGLLIYNLPIDFGGVFSLLATSSFESMMFSRNEFFYSTQRSRADIVAVPEVLCPPGKPGRPLAHPRVSDNYDDDSFDASEYTDSSGDDVGVNLMDRIDMSRASSNESVGSQQQKLIRRVSDGITAEDIDAQFESMNQPDAGAGSRDGATMTPAMSSRLDFLLAKKQPTVASVSDLVEKPRHRRSKSAPMDPAEYQDDASKSGHRTRRPSFRRQDSAQSSRGRSRSRTGSGLMRMDSYGSITDHQPHLLDQARISAASVASAEQGHRRRLSQSRSANHSRTNSQTSFQGVMGPSNEDLDRAFSGMVDEQVFGGSEQGLTVQYVFGNPRPSR